MTKKTIIITGTSSGLGKCIFEKLISIQNSIHIISISRRFSDDQKKYAGKNVKLVKIDLSKIASTNKDILDFGKNISDDVIFINNAGVINPIGGLGEIASTEIINNISINLIAPILILNKLVLVNKNKYIKLKIINISSGAANRPIAGWGLYCSTKAGMKMFLDAINISPNKQISFKMINYDPGVMDTGMQEEIRKSKSKEFIHQEKFVNFKRKNLLKNPEKVAEKIFKKYI
jgi:benzil reductase ((S)-benzoin forming)